MSRDAHEQERTSGRWQRRIVFGDVALRRAQAPRRKTPGLRMRGSLRSLNGEVEAEKDPPGEGSNKRATRDRFCERSLCLRRFDHLIVEPQQQSGGHTDGGDCPPESRRTMLYFAEVVQEKPADAPGDECADTERQKCKTHVSALLAGRRETGNIVVVTGLLSELAEGHDDKCDVCGGDGGVHSDHGKSDHRDQRTEEDGAKSADAFGEDADDYRERDYYDGAGGKHSFGVGLGIDVIVDVERESDELLPVDDPVASENQKEQHEFWIGYNFAEVRKSLGDGRDLYFVGLPGLLEEN